jgi:hypothetical protein
MLYTSLDSTIQAVRLVIDITVSFQARVEAVDTRNPHCHMLNEFDMMICKAMLSFLKIASRLFSWQNLVHML